LGEKKPLLWLYSKQLQLEPEALKVIVLKLQELDIIQITPISSKQSRLQHYFAYQEFNEDVAQINLQYLWKKLSPPILKDLCC
jgi:hypothetical protein